MTSTWPRLRRLTGRNRIIQDCASYPCTFFLSLTSHFSSLFLPSSLPSLLSLLSLSLCGCLSSTCCAVQLMEEAAPNADQPSTTTYDSLPLELLSHIFSFLSVGELYPSCFIINKTTTVAVRYNLVWEQRCRDELGLDERFPGCVNWMQTYKEGTQCVWYSHYSLPSFILFYFLRYLSLSDILFFILIKVICVTKAITTWDPSQCTIADESFHDSIMIQGNLYARTRYLYPPVLFYS